MTCGKDALAAGLLLVIHLLCSTALAQSRIDLSATSLSNFASLQGFVSTNQQVSINGTNLGANITIFPPVGWEISATNANNFTSGSIVLATNPAGVVSNTLLFVRLGASSPATTYSGAILQLNSIGTNTVPLFRTTSLFGTVIPQPVIQPVSPAPADFRSVQSRFSAAQRFNIAGSHLQSPLIVTAPTNYRIGSFANGPFTNQTVSIAPAADGSGSLTIYLAFADTNAPVGGPLSTNLVLSTALANPWSNNLPSVNRTNVLTSIVSASQLVAGFSPAVPDGAVSALATDHSGRLYVGGEFSRMVVNAVTNAARNLARLQTNGAFDPSFYADPGGRVSSVLYAPTNSSRTNAWLYIAGRFVSTNAVTNAEAVTTNTNWSVLKRLFIGRPAAELIPDGTVDTNFAPVGLGTNAPAQSEGLVLAMQQDGKLLVGGSFSNNIRRVNVDGTIDQSFAASTDGAVRAIALQSDGKILAAGSFARMSGSNSAGIARLNADGSLDVTFRPGQGFNGPVNALALASDGSIYAGGSFTAYGNWSANTYNNLVKLQPDGTRVGSFNYLPGLGTNGFVNAMLFRPSGQLLVGGTFTNASDSLAGYSVNVGRLVQFTNDLPDLNFNSGASGATNNSILALALNSNGDIAVGGSFTDFNGEGNLDRIALLSASTGGVPVMTSADFLTVPAGAFMSFQFTASPAGSTIANLSGTPPRGVTINSADGSMSGYPLDAGTYIFTNAPVFSGTTGNPTPFTLFVASNPVVYSNWVRAWFSPSVWTNTNVTGPLAVQSPSGLNNLQIYALTGGNPAQTGISALPVVGPEFSQGIQYLTLQATKYPLATGVAYTAQFSTNLSSPWLEGTDFTTTLENSADVFRARANIPLLTSSNQFLRLKISAP